MKWQRARVLGATRHIIGGISPTFNVGDLLWVRCERPKDRRIIHPDNPMLVSAKAYTGYIFWHPDGLNHGIDSRAVELLPVFTDDPETYKEDA